MSRTKKPSAPKKPATTKKPSTSKKPAAPAAQPARKRVDTRLKAGEVKALRDDLAKARAESAEARTQRDQWRATAKDKSHELALAEASAVEDHSENGRYQETHTVHNLLTGALFVAFVVSVGFNLWG